LTVLILACVAYVTVTRRDVETAPVEAVPAD
jgi:hypothetical protein